MRLAAQYLLAQFVAYSALIGATIEYIAILKRRVIRRRLEQDRMAAQETGLRGMVRVFLSER